MILKMVITPLSKYQIAETKTFENATSNTLDLSSLESGIYLIVLENDSQQKTIKVVKE